MLDTVYLQTEGSSVVLAIFASIIICLIFFIIQRRNLGTIKEKLVNLTTIDPKIPYEVSRIQTELQNVATNVQKLQVDLPHTNEVASLQENVKKLCDDFSTLKITIDDEINKFRLGTTEDLNKTKDQMITTATDKVVQIASEHINQNTITREEFESLKQRIEKRIGVEETSGRIELLSSIFDSSQLKILVWQCKIIKLLHNGLAPDVEIEQLTSEGISKAMSEKFLKRLTELGITESKKINAYYLLPDFEWIFSYIENLDWLQKKLEGTIKKESEYQEFIRDNLNQIEEGLLLEQEQYELATGKIDFICRDSTGRAVGLELKYPFSVTSVKRQIQGYKTDYEQKTGRNDSRFILVSPQIPDNLKELLTQDGFEYREISF